MLSSARPGRTFTRFIALICLLNLLLVPGISAQSSVSMREAINQGMVTVTIISSGKASGNIAQLTLTSIHNTPITVNVADSGLEGMILVNPDENEQDEIISDILGEMVTPTSYRPIPEIVLNPGDNATFLVNGYCINLDKANPSQGTEFTLSDTSSKTDVGQISGFIDLLESTTFPEDYSDNQKIVVTQIALWAAQPENKGLTRADYEERGYTVEDDYIPIIEDIIGTELFPEMTVGDVEKKETQAQQFDPMLLLGAGIVVALAGGIFLATRLRREKPADEFPKDLDKYKDRIQRAYQFAEDMANNYRKFIRLKEGVNEKKNKGEALTEEEKKIDEMNSYNEMQDWIKKQKEKKGYKLRTAGGTDPFGKMTSDAPTPKTAYDKFDDDITMKVHEPSHAQGAENDAKDVGLDWEKWKKWGKLRDKIWEAQDAGKSDAEVANSLTGEELDTLKWRLGNDDTIKKFLDRRNDPLRLAREEIGEYEAENAVRKRFLDSLEKKK